MVIIMVRPFFADRQLAIRGTDRGEVWREPDLQEECGDH
jgi:hypothetical protein